MKKYISIAIIFLISLGACVQASRQIVPSPGFQVPESPMMVQRQSFMQHIRGNELNLRGLNLDQIIPGVFLCPAFANVRQVIISENPRLTNIDNETFIGLVNVQELYLTMNGIDTIAPGAFIGLNRLKNLNLSTNNLTNIVSQVLEGLNLESLDLTINPIDDQTMKMLDELGYK